MIKEKINKIKNNKFFDLIVVVSINMIFFIISNYLFEFKYEQVDDFIIMNLISKADGSYSIYGVQMHPIICAIIILLYKTQINLNWYTIFMLSIQFVSFTIIGTVFARKSKKIGIPLYIVFLFAIYAKMLTYIQYTTVSMLSITSGLILLIHSIEEIRNINKNKLIFSILMIILGCLIRFSTIIIAVPFIAIYFICKYIKDRNIKIIKTSLLLILSLVIVNISFKIIYNVNPIYREFLKFHDARTYLHDYNWMKYEGNEEIFNTVNWSKNDRDIFYAYCFGDEETYNTEKLEQLQKRAIINTKSDYLINKIINVANDFCSSVKSSTYKYVFLIVGLLVISNNLSSISRNYKNKTDKDEESINIVFCNLVFISIVAMHCLFIYLNRPMFRVVISIYIIGIAMLIYKLIENFKGSNKLIIKYICIICILFASFSELQQNITYAQYFNKDNYSVYKDIINYTSSHKENAYLYTLVMHDRFLAYSVYEKIPDNSYENIRPLGDWDTCTENYYDFKERYDIKNLIESLYKNDNVYLISGKVIWGEYYKEYINIIEKYILEHYGVNIESNIVKEFDNGIKIYKLKEK